MTIPLIYWNLFDSSQLPDNIAWLSEEELQQLQSFRFEKRRKDWLQGRWTAKRLIQSLFAKGDDLSSGQICIKNETSGAPYAMIKGEKMKASLSISHRGNLASTAICTDPDITIGIDLEEIENKSQGFIEDYFTTPESEYVFALPQKQQAWAASLLWSGREAILKALQTGLRYDTREIAIHCPSFIYKDEWEAIEIIKSPEKQDSTRLFWRKLENYLITLAVISKNEQFEILPENILAVEG
ncbi:MAG: 4'-phosphopantetheinyl transferase superfamily protein [Anaerolineaceae bacterium]|nr:4'-phosphopantetheinyl transferase superfamily protein [Anaerolineaceae bacterium]